MVIGAVDLGGTKVAVGVVDEGGRVLSRREFLTEAGRGPQPALDRIRSNLRECVAASSGRLAGIGVASPGPVDPFSGRIGRFGTLPGWEGCQLVAELAPFFNVPVAVENDADAAALAESAWGAGTGVKTFLYVTVSTGIGAGIVLGGQLYRGVEGAHPEIGHQVIDPSGPTCYCGANGCWESLAAGPAVERWFLANDAAQRFAEITAAEVFDLAGQGDPVAIKAATRQGYYLGLGLANLITVLCPDLIALGGGVMKSWHLFMDTAKQTIRQVCGEVPHEKTAIVPTELGLDVGLVGAARVWQHRYGGAG